MKSGFEQSNGNLIVKIEGRLDTTTAPELEVFLGSHYQAIDALTFDCEKLEYISSAGLRVFLAAHKKMKGAMKLINVNEVVTEVLEITGFADLWGIA